MYINISLAISAEKTTTNTTTYPSAAAFVVATHFITDCCKIQIFGGNRKEKEEKSFIPKSGTLYLVFRRTFNELNTYNSWALVSRRKLNL